MVISLIVFCGIVGGETLVSGPLYPAKYNTTRGTYYGYIDKVGEWRVKPEYDYGYLFSEGYGVLSKNGKYGVVDGKGKIIIPLMYDSISPYKEERAVFSDEKGMGIIDTKGNVITKKYYAYIQDYSSGLAVVGEQVGDKSLYGYIDEEGEEVIPPKYESATAFNGDKALVMIGEGAYQLIDKKGNVVTPFMYPYVYGYNEGYLIYKDKTTGKYGYLDEQGKVVVPPKYESAEPFKSGVAVVGTSQFLMGENGLIDTKGNEIYPTIYNDILNLGEGRVALGQALAIDEPFVGSMYALADTTGEALTDFEFNGISDFQDGKASVYNEEYSYFIDNTGKKLKDFPQILGSGILTNLGEVIKGDLDYTPLYLGKYGNVIYVPNGTVQLDKERRVITELYKPNLNYVVYYPQLKELENEGNESTINDKLKAQTMHQDVTSKEVLEYSYYSDFIIPFYQKNLLELDLRNSTYYFGAAHPIPGRLVEHVDLQTGTFYTLEDLFKPESNWKEKLNTILNKMAKEEPIASQIYSDQEKVVIEDQQGFTVDDANLYIYYSPYEIGPYSSGYITFKIPYTEIMDIINEEGAFWKSYKP